MTYLEKTLEVMKHARSLIEKGWHQGNYAKNGNSGRVVDYHNPSATCFCSLGAIYRAGADKVSASDGVSEHDVTWRVEMALRTALGPNKSIVTFNDHPDRTKEEVLALFDKGIGLVEQKLAEEP